MTENYKGMQISEELAAILDAALDDSLITDGDGNVILVSAKFKEMYGVNKEEVIGQSVYELEKQGIFKPSITKIVLEKRHKITMLQENREGRKIIVSAVPIKNSEGDIEKVVSFSRDVTELTELQEQFKTLERKVELYEGKISEWESSNLDGALFTGKSKAMQNVTNLVNKVAKFDANVLITGESGVGKTMFARMIHANSERKDGEMVEVNCGAIPGNLLESELFGYEKGSFTGADKAGKIGLIELADKGTLLLDEVGEIPLNLQVKLLKVIQDKAITRVGGIKSIPIDFRLISATNRDLNEFAEGNKFRKDLYYRLNVIHVHTPALRERREDIFPLAIYFLEKFNLKYNMKKILSPKLVDAFTKYSWPGNIRELENLVERIILTSGTNIIDESILPKYFKAEKSFSYLHGTLDDAVNEVEKKMVISAYEKHKTTVGVAKELGISQPTAVRKIKKHIQK